MIEITDADFDRTVLQAGRPAVVDFWAPWCRPCESVTRILEELEVEHGERVLFAKLDIDSSPVTAAKYGVLSIPTAIVFEGGEPCAQVIGARPRHYFERAFATWLPGETGST